MRKHTMRNLAVLALLGAASVGRAADLSNLPPNTWVEIKYTTAQPSDRPDEQGQWRPVGWNKLVYDPNGKRVLFYDRWVDKKHGGLTIYGNCLFAFDPAAATVKPIKIDNWTVRRPEKGGYRTLALEENDKEPTPCPRHVYHAFAYVPDQKAVFITNGANQSAMLKDGKVVGHDLCTDTWRFDLKTNQWSKINAPGSPPIGLTMRWRIARIPRRSSMPARVASCGFSIWRKISGAKPGKVHHNMAAWAGRSSTTLRKSACCLRAAASSMPG